MKQGFYCLAITCCLLLPGVATGQLIVDNDGDMVLGSLRPDPSAILDLDSKTKGLLIPRMTTKERDAMKSPAQGLMIYNVDTKEFQYNHGLDLGGTFSPEWTCVLADANLGKNAWLLNGNEGTNPAKNFLGTRDDQPLYIRISSDSPRGGRGRVASFIPGGQSPSIIMGYKDNASPFPHDGVTISGGGSRGMEHLAAGDYITISGGRGNVAGSRDATVSGGSRNQVYGRYGTVGGGTQNIAQDTGGVVSGGSGNRAFGKNSVISGGSSNVVNERGGTIGGGVSNSVSEEGGTISGGILNKVTELGTVSGGMLNAAGDSSFIGGGYWNQGRTSFATIGGGYRNRVVRRFGTVSGGDSNTTGGEYATVGGGRDNLADGSSTVVGGGNNNSVRGLGSTISGGTGNALYGNNATISGGKLNVVGTNRRRANNSTIGGGFLNNIQGSASAIPGGNGLTLLGSRAFGFLAATEIVPGQSVDLPMSIAASDVAVYGNADLWLVNNNGVASELRFYEREWDTGAFPSQTSFTSFKAGDQSENIVYTLPTSLTPVKYSTGAILQTDQNGRMSWVATASLRGNDTWILAGNSRTDPSIDFLGTIDSAGLVLRTHNQERVRLDPIGNLGIGTPLPDARLDVQNTSNTFSTLALRNTHASGTALSIDDGRMALSYRTYSANDPGGAVDVPTIDNDVIVVNIDATATDAGGLPEIDAPASGVDGQIIWVVNSTALDVTLNNADFYGTSSILLGTETVTQIVWVGGINGQWIALQ